MPHIPPMITPSPATTLAFVTIVLGLCALLVIGAGAAGRALGEPRALRRRWMALTALGTAVWLLVSGLISASGVLAAGGMPPLLPLFVIASLAVSVFAARSTLGTRLSHQLPIAALILPQAFRVPLELVLHQWYVEGVLPVQMTYAGNNFDIVSGVLAAIVGGAALRGQLPRWLIRAWNVLGLGLLTNVAAIAMLSSPLPIRRFLNDPPVLLAFHFPYGWILPFCVGGALFGHILVFRWLALAHTAQPRALLRNSAGQPL